MSRRRTPRAVRPRLPVHTFAGLGVCCNLPKRNPVHDLTLLPARTAEEQAYDAARLGEHEDTDEQAF